MTSSVPGPSVRSGTTRSRFCSVLSRLTASRKRMRLSVMTASNSRMGLWGPMFSSPIPRGPRQKPRSRKISGNDSGARSTRPATRAESMRTAARTAKPIAIDTMLQITGAAERPGSGAVDEPDYAGHRSNSAVVHDRPSEVVHLGHGEGAVGVDRLDIGDVTDGRRVADAFDHDRPDLRPESLRIAVESSVAPPLPRVPAPGDIALLRHPPGAVAVGEAVCPQALGAGGRRHRLNRTDHGRQVIGG